MEAPNVGHAYALVLAAEREKLAQLQAQVREKEALIAALAAMVPGDGKASPAPVAVSRPPGERPGEGETWGAKIDAILASEPGRKWSPREIIEALKARGETFSTLKVHPGIMVRGNLRRYAGKRGWKFKKKGHNVLWWKEAVSQGS